MLVNKRYEYILDLLREKGAVTTLELSRNLNVSDETIRRDLTFLSRENKLLKVHGGAVLKNDMMSFSNLSGRKKESVSNKENLGILAAGYVKENDVIGIDSGSTAISFAKALTDKFTNLTIITFSSEVFDILNGCNNFKVILCGGMYKEEEKAFYGVITVDTIKSLHMNKVFICPSAISLNNGINDFDFDIFPNQRQMLYNGDKVFILADSTKYEKNGVLKLSDLKKEYTYITDKNISDDLIKLYEENEIKIYKN